MKKVIPLLSLVATMFSCNQAATEKQNSEETSVQSSVEIAKADTAKGFNIEDIAFSNADLGDFPYFTLPKGLKAMNKPLQKNFDVCFFPIGGVMTAFEGKLYKVNVGAEQGEEFSQRYFEKSLEDYLLSIGAVKVFDGEISKEAYDVYHKQDANKGGEGDMGYADEQIKFFVIRSKTEGNIYVQYTSNNAAGKLNILQEAALVQTISKVTADDIVKDLAEKGKSILYINFEVDKSDIAPDGKAVVDEIAEALKKDAKVNIAIEGHTDNTGDGAHNKKLSQDRAGAVLTALLSHGIAKGRLSAKGFGAERPLVANDSEDNMAKNRRVELVKTN